MSIWTRLYRHSNFGGNSTFASLPQMSPPTSYLRISKSWLSSASLHDRISSLRLGASRNEQAGYVALFQHARYKGRYAMFSVNGNSSRDIMNLQSQNFNDITSSVLIIRQNSVELPPIALGSLGRPGIRERIRDEVASNRRLRARGDPIITWDMWPNHAPSQKFVYIRVPVRVDVSGWFDYDAEIRFWIYLYVDAAGRARGHVAWYGCWVEGGIISGKIKDRLMDEIPSSIGDIQEMLDEALSSLSIFELSGLYLLPGRAQTVGHVEDDCSIVLVKRW